MVLAVLFMFMKQDMVNDKLSYASDDFGSLSLDISVIMLLPKRIRYHTS